MPTFSDSNPNKVRFLMHQEKTIKTTGNFLVYDGPTLCVLHPVGHSERTWMCSDGKPLRAGEANEQSCLSRFFLILVVLEVSWLRFALESSVTYMCGFGDSCSLAKFDKFCDKGLVDASLGSRGCQRGLRLRLSPA